MVGIRLGDRNYQTLHKRSIDCTRGEPAIYAIYAIYGQSLGPAAIYRDYLARPRQPPNTDEAILPAFGSIGFIWHLAAAGGSRRGAADVLRHGAHVFAWS